MKVLPIVIVYCFYLANTFVHAAENKQPRQEMNKRLEKILQKNPSYYNLLSIMRNEGQKLGRRVSFRQSAQLVLLHFSKDGRRELQRTFPERFAFNEEWAKSWDDIILNGAPDYQRLLSITTECTKINKEIDECRAQIIVGGVFACFAAGCGAPSGIQVDQSAIALIVEELYERSRVFSISQLSRIAQELASAKGIHHFNQIHHKLFEIEISNFSGGFANPRLSSLIISGEMEHNRSCLLMGAAGYILGLLLERAIQFSLRSLNVSKATTEYAAPCTLLFIGGVTVLMHWLGYRLDDYTFALIFGYLCGRLINMDTPGDCHSIERELTRKRREMLKFTRGIFKQSFRIELTSSWREDENMHIEFILENASNLNPAINFNNNASYTAINNQEKIDKLIDLNEYIDNYILHI